MENKLNKTNENNTLKILKQKLNDSMFKYDLNYNIISRSTGYTRQSITKYFKGDASPKFEFLMAYYKLLNNIEPAHNINFLYFIIDDCDSLYKTTKENLESIGISNLAVNNIIKATTSELTSRNELQEYLDLPNYNFKKLFFLNLLLENDGLSELLDSLSKIFENYKYSHDYDNYTKSFKKSISCLGIKNIEVEKIIEIFSNTLEEQNKNTDNNFLNWELENCIKKYVFNLATQLTNKK